jgi:hypothetical protein
MIAVVRLEEAEALVFISKVAGWPSGADDLPKAEVVSLCA